MLYQTDFPTATRLPRWGCFIVDIYLGVCLFVGIDPSQADMLELYKRGICGKILTITGSQLNCDDPDGWIQLCLDFYYTGRYRGFQTGDEEGYFTYASWSPPHSWTFLLDRWLRPEGGHYLCYYPEKGVVLDPMGGKLHLEPCKNFRRFYIGRV